MKNFVILFLLSSGLTISAFSQNYTTNMRVETSSPTIYFKDTSSNHEDWWIHVNSNRMYFLWDQGDDGDWDGPYPLYLDRREAIFGSNVIFKTGSNDVGDLIFRRGDNGQLGRIWSNNSGASGLYLSSGDNNHDILIDQNGDVGIGGVSNPRNALDVNGTIRAKEVIVESGWSDYVFEKDYVLAPLSEVEVHIAEKGHLPGIPSAAEIETNGAKLSELVTLQMAKIEELTLHLIEKEKQLEHERLENEAQSRQLSSILTRLSALER